MTHSERDSENYYDNGFNEGARNMKERILEILNVGKIDTIMDEIGGKFIDYINKDELNKKIEKL